MSDKKEDPKESWHSPLGIDPKKDIASAILWVSEQCPYVQKTGETGGGKMRYTFASSADIISVLHMPMVAAGLVLFPKDVQILKTEIRQSSEGKFITHVFVVVEWALKHSPSNDQISLKSLGESADSFDKALPKAQTIAHKYALRLLFNIETGDDPDSNSGSGITYPPDQQPQNPWQQPQPQGNWQPQSQNNWQPQPQGNWQPQNQQPQHQNNFGGYNPNDDPKTGPFSDSYVRVLDAISKTNDPNALNSILSRCAHNPGRSWNYRPSQVKGIGEAIGAKLASLNGNSQGNFNNTGSSESQSAPGGF